MSTHTENPPVQPPRQEPHEEYTGPFGFFRKYQKLILYTAGIFALVTFSITTSVTSFFSGFSGGATGPQPWIVVGGRRVEIEQEDLLYGNLLAKNGRSTYVLGQPRVLPEIGQGSVHSDLGICYAILRRASIAAGLDVSMTEVDRAIDWIVRAWNHVSKRSDSAGQMALAVGMSSLAEWRTVVKEAMRIGNYVRLNSLGIDASDAALMDKILEGQEMVTARAAVFDMQAREAQIKQDRPIGETDLRAWFDKREEKDKNLMQVYDTNRVSLLLGAIRYADLKPEEWPDELKEFKFGDEQQKQLYEQEKLHRFKTEKAGEFKPLSDEAVQAEVRKVAEVDQVLNGVLAKLRERLQEALKAPTEELTRCGPEKLVALQDRDAAKAALAAKPDDADLQQKLREKEEVLVAKETAENVAKTALEDARKAFDFRGQFLELIKDKDGKERSGCAVIEIKGPKNAKELEDLGDPLGAWGSPQLATSLQNVGDLGAMPARAKNGGFLLQATEVVVRPLKPWDEIKAKIEEAYYIDEAKQIGATQKQALETALLTLAKARIAERVSEIEGRRTAEVDKRYLEWESKLLADIARADEYLANRTPGTQAYKSFEVLKQVSQKQLDQKDTKKSEIDAEVGKELETEVKKEARKEYGAVLEEAAKQADFVVGPHGPYFRQLMSQIRDPLVRKGFDKAVPFLWGGPVNNLKVGEVTDLIEDTTNRRWVVAVVDKVEPRPSSDVSRREFTTERLQFTDSQVAAAIEQSFTLEALKQRYKYESPEGKQVEENK